MHKLRFVSKIFVSALFLLSLFGCKSNEGANPVSSSYFYPPVASGMWITTESATVVGIWGNPNSEFKVFPNPFNQSLIIPVYVKQDSSEVNIWIVRALSPFEENAKTDQFGGGGFLVASGKPVEEFSFSSIDSGHRALRWIAAGLPDGFYRIYVQINNELQLTDVFLANDPRNIPSGITYF